MFSLLRCHCTPATDLLWAEFSVDASKKGELWCTCIAHIIKVHISTATGVFQPAGNFWCGKRSTWLCKSPVNAAALWLVVCSWLVVLWSLVIYVFLRSISVTLCFKNSGAFWKISLFPSVSLGLRTALGLGQESMRPWPSPMFLSLQALQLDWTTGWRSAGFSALVEVRSASIMFERSARNETNWDLFVIGQDRFQV